MDVHETKTLRQYSNKQKILLVGEGDFSFSLSLAEAFGSATNITATSLDTRDELARKYTYATSNVDKLERLGCTVLHGVNVHSMTSDYRLAFNRYDRIVFNFPHSGLGFRAEWEIIYIMEHQKVVRGFFESARKLVKDGNGEIHVTHKTNYPFNMWEIKTLAQEKGLVLTGEMEFYQYAFFGYSNKRGAGSNCDGSFPINSAVTFIFKK